MTHHIAQLNIGRARGAVDGKAPSLRGTVTVLPVRSSVMVIVSGTSGFLPVAT